MPRMELAMWEAFWVEWPELLFETVEASDAVVSAPGKSVFMNLYVLHIVDIHFF